MRLPNDDEQQIRCTKNKWKPLPHTHSPSSFVYNRCFPDQWQNNELKTLFNDRRRPDITHTHTHSKHAAHGDRRISRESICMCKSVCVCAVAANGRTKTEMFRMDYLHTLLKQYLPTFLPITLLRNNTRCESVCDGQHCCCEMIRCDYYVRIHQWWI